MRIYICRMQTWIKITVGSYIEKLHIAAHEKSAKDLKEATI